MFSIVLRFDFDIKFLHWKEDFEAEISKGQRRKDFVIQTIIVRVGSLDDNSRSTASDSIGSRI